MIGFPGFVGARAFDADEGVLWCGRELDVIAHDRVSLIAPVPVTEAHALDR
jgi:hypothetical protein